MSRSEGSLLTGVVKRYSTKNGFGFITCEDGEEDVFVHQNEIQSEGYRKLDIDQRVQFEFGLREGKPNAFKVTPIDSLPGTNNTPDRQFKGKCKWFNAPKGFGFLIGDDREGDVFVHIKELPRMTPLVEGQKVWFDLAEKDEAKGSTTAVRVVLDGPPPVNLPPNTFAGTVKWFDVKKGFGFIIKDDDNSDIFVHTRECPGQLPLSPGQDVHFELQKRSDDKGDTAACNVRVPHHQAHENQALPSFAPQGVHMGGMGGMGGMGSMGGSAPMSMSAPMGMNMGPMGMTGMSMGSPNMGLGMMGGGSGRPMYAGGGGPAPYGHHQPMSHHQPMGAQGPFDGYDSRQMTGSAAGGRVGVVKWFNPDKKFGFILPGDAAYEVMVGQDALQGCDVLHEGTTVEFEATEQSPGRWKARYCRISRSNTPGNPGSNGSNGSNNNQGIPSNHSSNKRPHPHDQFANNNNNNRTSPPQPPYGKAARTEYSTNGYQASPNLQQHNYFTPGQPIYAPYPQDPYNNGGPSDMAYQHPYY